MPDPLYTVVYYDARARSEFSVGEHTWSDLLQAIQHSLRWYRQRGSELRPIRVERVR